METIKLTVNGREIVAFKGMTILEVVEHEGIEIPTLCYHPHLEPYAACRICLVEVEGTRNPLPACVTQANEGMVIHTRTDDIYALRKMALELLLSDHYGDCIAPCKLACPAGIDIQGQLALIAEGKYKEALKVIKESNPLPLVCGRVCPRFCEDKCRRNLIDGPVAINYLKRFVADYDINSGEPYQPEKKPATGHKVAIVGGGPAGLTAAYYLALDGHTVDLYCAHPQLGGMLRYGIPEYRLPKAILDEEIALITCLCNKVSCNSTLGKDFTIDSLKKEGYEAIFLPIGAQSSQKMAVDGEDIPGVIAGIDFLRQVVVGDKVEIGKKVAIIGGGNTAMDAARTALRLGSEVTVIYRRSREEMPAHEEEIEQAEEEGVKIVFLVAPVSVVKGNGKISGIKCIKMSLGEPDTSGRRRPVPIEGSEYCIDVDTVIVAIGQTLDSSALLQDSQIQIDRRGYLVAESETMQTPVDGVFSGGDCVSGPATAVEAIAAGKKAAQAINQYLNGQQVAPVHQPYNCSKGELNEIDVSQFDGVPTVPRVLMPALNPTERIKGSEEIELGITEEMAKREADRCLSCGCHDVYECKLREYATEYNVDDKTYAPLKHKPLVNKEVNQFFIRDNNKCILCGQCVGVCGEVRGNGVISFINKGRHIFVGTAFNKPLEESGCQFCGACVDTCPTGALLNHVDHWVGLPDKEVTTICPYCGVGCQLILQIKNNEIVGVVPDINGPANRGQACVMGRFGLSFVNDKHRLKTPLIKQGDGFREATWDEALELVVKKFSECSGDQFALTASAKTTNEDNYVMQKFARVVMGTNNVDHCARLCHAPTVAGLLTMFGSGAMTNSIAEISDARCIFAIGTNTTVNLPVVALEIKKAIRKGSKLIVANPLKIELCNYADIWLRLRPGTDVALIGGIIRVIVDEGLIDEKFIADRCENYSAMKESLRNFDIRSVEAITGVPAELIVEAARLYASSTPSSILYSMGVTQHSHGTDSVHAIANLAMVTGNVGKPSSGINPLRGQNNVQGACDMGCLPNVFPGYQGVSDPEKIEKFEAAWNCKLDAKVGLTLEEMFEAVDRNNIKTMYIVGENLVITNPDITHVKKSLEKLDFLVVQDIFLTETARMADVVLPSVSFAEKDGTFTNTERRIQLVNFAVEPLGEARGDWQIVCEIAKRMGAAGFDYQNASQIMDEIARLSPAYAGISYKRLNEMTLQWPCLSTDHPGSVYLHGTEFSRGKGRFIAMEYKPSMEQPDNEYPLLLTTGRERYHFHTDTMIEKVHSFDGINGEAKIRISPDDAELLGIVDGEMIQMSSRRGKITAIAEITDEVPWGVVFMPFHFAESAVNLLTNPARDPVSNIPELKVCAVRLDKITS